MTEPTTVKFSPAQKKKVNEIIESRVKRENKRHAQAMAEALGDAKRDLAYWKHKAAFYGGQVALLTEQNSRLTSMVSHPSNTQEKK